MSPCKAGLSQRWTMKQERVTNVNGRPPPFTCSSRQSITPGFSRGECQLSVPLVLSVAIMGVMPGICEEVLHRGLILHTLKNQKNDTVKIILMAAIFGVFHIDPYRFLPTALIGLVLSYIMIKTENILLPVLLHFANKFGNILTLFDTKTKKTIDMKNFLWYNIHQTKKNTKARLSVPALWPPRNQKFCRRKKRNIL